MSIRSFLFSIAILIPSIAFAQSTLSPRYNGVTANTGTFGSANVSGGVNAGSLTLSGSGSTGDVSGMSVTATGGNTARTNAARAADVVNPMDYGAKCDDSTDDSAALTTVIALGRPISIPAGKVCRAASIGPTALAGVFVGPGRVRTSDGNLRAAIYTGWQAAPGASNWGSTLTAFNGSLTGTFAHEHQIAGAATLGQPTSGYVQTPETSAYTTYTTNRSGYNFSLTGNGGRTGTAAYFSKFDNYGQGDFTSYFCSGLVASQLPGAQNFLASPQVSCLGGDLFAAQNGVYLQGIGDLNLRDNGFDVGAIGITMNLNRTNATENLGALWMGIRLQNQGTQPLDAIISANSKAAVGLDFSSLDLSTYSLAQHNLGVGGSGYVVGDLLTMSGGTSTVPATIKVTAVDGSGAITGFSVANVGLYSVSPATGQTTAWVGGTGTGATFYAVFTNGSAIVLPSGGCIKGNPVVAGTFPNTMLRGSTNTICFQAGGTQIGNGGTINSAAGAGVVQIGTSNLSLGSNNVQFGQNTYDDAQKNSLLFSSGWFTDTAGFGSSQIGWRVMRGTTSTTTAIRLTTDQGGSSSSNSYLVVASSVHSFETVCNAVDTVNGDFASWKSLNGVANRVGSGNVAYQGDASTAKSPDYSSGAGASATITISADTTAQTINITFTPPTSNARKWHAQCAVRSLKIQ